MYHVFDTAIAGKVGVNAAILFHNISFWCDHSAANGSHYHDGHYWTYSSVKAFCELFPYLGKSQIENALQKLIDAGLIIKGNYNTNTYDRTAWYAITETGKCISENREMENPENGNGFAKNRKPIPYINTDSKPDESISSPRKRGKNEIPESFTRFWNVYPRKAAKQNAVKTWAKLNPDEETTERIIANIMRRLETDWRGKEMQYIPHPATFLNQRRWEDETGETERATRGEPAEEDLFAGMSPEGIAELERLAADGEHYG